MERGQMYSVENEDPYSYENWPLENFLQYFDVTINKKRLRDINAMSENQKFLYKLQVVISHCCKVSHFHILSHKNTV